MHYSSLAAMYAAWYYLRLGYLVFRNLHSQSNLESFGLSEFTCGYTPASSATSLPVSSAIQSFVQHCRLLHPHYLTTLPIAQFLPPPGCSRPYPSNSTPQPIGFLLSRPSPCCRENVNEQGHRPCCRTPFMADGNPSTITEWAYPYPRSDPFPAAPNP